MLYRLFALMLFVVFSLSACNLGTDDNNDSDGETPIEGETTPTPPEASSPPQVEILSPLNGEEFVVNEPILINISASDSIGVTSVRLSANNNIVRTVASESVSGDAQRDLILDYTPRTQGEVVLSVVALRGRIQSDPASVTVNVRSNEQQVTATPQQDNNVPVIDPNDRTCRALINTGLNFRSGPSTDFPVIRVLRAGEVIPIVGKLPDESWWQLNSGGAVGWVDQRFITRYGVCTNIQTLTTPTPTATTTPTPTSQPPTPLPTATDLPTATPSQPDLIVSNIDGPRTVRIPIGQTSVTHTYSVNITNEGGPINRQFENLARIISPLDTEIVDIGAVGNLAQNQSISLSFDVTFAMEGTIILEAEADSELNITESDEGNNTRILRITVIQEVSQG